ncbi:MAG: peptidyl-prolyl cis-trans isomerase [Thermodesulfobacteriota bacterium]|nr:peptidyl-prolyl cis-trans isomerase [Thermodesulfobacteriota bacterium]
MTLGVFCLFAVLLSVFLDGCGPKIGEDTAALVNGRPVRMKALGLAVRSWSEPNQTGAGQSRLRRRLLDHLIEEELVVQEAEGRGLTVSEAELMARVKEVKADYPHQTFDEMLIREYIDFETWQERLKRNILIKRVTEAELKSRVTVKPKEWEAFFQEHRQVQGEPARLKVKHITTLTRAEAEKALKRIKAGQDFDLVARSLEGPDTGSKQTAFAWVYPERLPAPLAKALLETGAGRVSGIVESEYGFSIFKVLAVQEARPLEPTEIIKRLHRLYIKDLRAKAYTQWIGELKARAVIIINPSLM